jgi:hypothetical protein
MVHAGLVDKNLNAKPKQPIKKQPKPKKQHRTQTNMWKSVNQKHHIKRKNKPH